MKQENSMKLQFGKPKLLPKLDPSNKDTNPGYSWKPTQIHANLGP